MQLDTTGNKLGKEICMKHVSSTNSNVRATYNITILVGIGIELSIVHL